MSMGALRVAARIVAVVGIVGALVMQGNTASATDSITFTSCSSPTPSPTPSSSPTSSPTAPPSSSPTAPPSAGPQQAPEEPQNCVPNSGSIITDVRTLQFTVQTDSFRTHIEEVLAFLESQSQGVKNPGPVPLNCPTADEDTSFPNNGCQSGNAQPTSGTYSFNWDSNTITPSNGVYRFRVNAHFVGVNRDRWVTQPANNNQCPRGCSLVVDNAPVQPNAPRIVVSTASSVSLAWDANPEPDVLSYSVYRAVTKDKKTAPTAGQFKLQLSTTGTSARDTVNAPGAYWYRVQAARKSYNPQRNGFIASSLSDTSPPASVAAASSTSAGKPRPHRNTGGSVRALPPRAAALLTPPGLIPSVAAAPPPVPDAPYSAYLPYKSNEAFEEAGPEAPEAGTTTDPRGAVLPVAVGAFLVSSALALGRMPF